MGFLDEVSWNADGLAPVIACDRKTNKVLMMAWVNREALAESAATGRAVYYSRSRKRLWRKGEESGHVQTLFEIRLDCDADCLLYLVEQNGLACHTGRESCFFRKLSGAKGSETWETVDPVIKNPEDIYKK